MLSISSDALFMLMDDEMVAMNTATDRYFNISDTGSRTWCLIEDQETGVEILYRELVSFFAGEDPETIKTDMFEFLDSCADLGLINID